MTFQYTVDIQSISFSSEKELSEEEQTEQAIKELAQAMIQKEIYIDSIIEEGDDEEDEDEFLCLTSLGT